MRKGQHGVDGDIRLAKLDFGNVRLALAGYAADVGLRQPGAQSRLPHIAPELLTERFGHGARQ